MTRPFLPQGRPDPSHGGPVWPQLPPPERDLLDRLLLFAGPTGAAPRAEVLRETRTAAARTALAAECGNGRWSDIVSVHLLGLLAWTLWLVTGDERELAVAADWLVIVRRVDPVLLPEPLRSAGRERFTAAGLPGLVDAAGGREYALTLAARFIGSGLGWAATPGETEAVAAYVRARNLLRDDAPAADEEARQALSLLPAGRHWLTPFALDLAACACGLRTMAEGGLASEDAVRLAQRAVDIVPADHPLLPKTLTYLHTLRVGLLARQLRPTTPALEPSAAARCREVVELGRRALAVREEDDEKIAVTLRTQTAALFLLLSCDPRDPVLRAEMTRHGRLAAGRLSGSPADEAAVWLDMGDRLKLLFLWTTEPERLAEMTEVLETACRVAPAGSVLEARAVCALGWAEFIRAGARGDLTGLNAAAEHHLRVIDLLGLPVPEDSPDEAAQRALERTRALAQFQQLLTTRAELIGDRDSRMEVLAPQTGPLPEVVTGTGDFFDLQIRRQLAQQRFAQAQQLFVATCAQAFEDLRPQALRRACETLRGAADEYAAAVPDQRHLADGAHTWTGHVARQADAMEAEAIEPPEAIDELVATLVGEGAPELLLDDALFGRVSGGQPGRGAPAEAAARPAAGGTADATRALPFLKGHEVARLRLSVALGQARQALGARLRGEPHTAAWSRALVFSERGYADPAVSPLNLVPHAWFMARIAARLDDLPGVAPLLATAVRATASLASPRFRRADQEAMLTLYANGLGDQACAAALLAGEPAERALAVLETARGLLAAARLNSMSDLGTLRRACPEAASRFEAATAELTAAQEETPAPRLAAMTRRHRAADRWEGELDRIRGLPGFGDFLRPLDAATVRSLADHGPVVHLTLHSVRSHALLLTADGVEALPLPGASPTRAQEWTGRLEQARGEPGTTGAQQVRAVLGELWDAVAKPVLDALGLRTPPGGPADRPRLWWIPSGQAVLLPLHAAGRFIPQVASPGTVPCQAPGDNVLDRVISSYAPTLRALRHARLRVAPAGRPGVLAIAVPGGTHEPGSLRWAGLEAQDVLAGVGAGRYLEQGEATLAAVGRALREHPWLHFAGHAASPQDGPRAGTSGGLLLGDTLLTPQIVDRLALPSAELAFLSGCGTARGTSALADESLHVASALHLAGYRDVVGTLWPVRDRAAALIAERFYGGLRAGAVRGGAAPALDAAVHATRQEQPARPDLWAAHLHIGP
ncbi:CHAT domain-containing protein [Streptomyces sp. SL13]|uniref:CHAT domain-containing protein n=1 Tax=Streptantibioticus silvisoli TaxID=2705255 RepID=A0AA90K751_9ACTN|nr:CHAT domain-containing protein [Streptantibioticus silvisoli]MDI5968563.1 CHAT domain-containing protein [Streptantibioticus silvisoli]